MSERQKFKNNNVLLSCKICIFPKLTKTNCIGILYDGMILVFFGEGWGAMDIRREFKGLTVGSG